MEKVVIVWLLKVIFLFKFIKKATLLLFWRKKCRKIRLKVKIFSYIITVK